MTRVVLTVLLLSLPPGVAAQAGAQNTTPVNTELPPATATADDIANPTVPGVRAYMYDFDGTDWSRLRFAATFGEVTANPTANTVLGRLASLESLFAAFVPPGIADGATFSAGSTLQPAGYVRRDTPGPGTGVANGDIGVPCMSQFGGVCTQLLDQTGAVATFAPDAQHGQTVPATGPMSMGEAKVFDGVDLPNSVTEGQAVRIATTARGIIYTIPVNQTGSIEKDIPCTPNSSISTAAVMETEVRATAGTLCSFSVQHIDATAVMCRLYNDTAANTDQTDTPVQRFLIPANATAALGSGTVNLLPAKGLAFTTAITFRCTAGVADADTGALTANEVFVSYSSTP